MKLHPNTKHGLWAATPPRVVQLPPNGTSLRDYANDLADAALWMSGALAASDEGDPDERGRAARLAAQFAEVAHELYGLRAALEGGAIRPAKLGALTPEQFEQLIVRQRDALELVLSRCTFAMKYIRANGLTPGEESSAEEGDKRGTSHSMLRVLAVTMRRARVMMQALAANYAWSAAHRESESTDLGDQVMGISRER